MLFRKSLLCLLFFFVASHAQDGGSNKLSDLSFPVPLTDETFEHETQASTGQTTGSWLVWIYRADKDVPIYGEMPDESVWTDLHIVWGTMNVKYATDTRARFGLSKLPAVMFIHKSKYYEVPQPAGGYTWEGLVRFCSGDFASMPAHDIPQPRSPWDTFYKLIEQAKTEGGVLFGGIAMVFAALLIAAIVNQSSKKGSKKKKE